MCVARLNWIVRIVRYLICCVVVNSAHFSKKPFKFLADFVNSMAGEYCTNDRRSLTISVAVLGVTLSIVFLSFFAFSEINNDPDTSTIQFAAFIFRHGERSPTGLYPNDPHQNYTWIGGFGALTPKGALQGYNLGTKLRFRYKKLLPSNGFYSTNEMYVLSSATERCLMTAQSFLAGFLPPTNELYKLPIQWQPVAVNSIPRDRDRIVSQKATCAKYDEMLAKMYTDPPEELRNFVDTNQELFKYISLHTGANITSVHQGEQLYNILSIEKDNGLELPKWTESVFPDKLLALAQRNLAVLTENAFMKRVKGGYLVTDVIDKMMAKMKNQLKPNRKIFIYSGHDVTLVNVMRALNIIDQTTRKPDYTAALHFELHHNPHLENDLEVKIFYSFNYDSDLTPISIPNCDSPCSLANFVESVEPITIRDYDSTCKI